jgi:hypothetical protein
MSELEYDTNYATWAAAAGITPATSPLSLKGLIKALCTAQGAPSITVTTPTLGAAAQLAQTTLQSTIMIDVTTAGNLVVAIGPTSGVANTIFTGTSPIQLLTIPLPAAWYIAVTTSNTAVWSATVLNGM